MTSWLSNDFPKRTDLLFKILTTCALLKCKPNPPIKLKIYSNASGGLDFGVKIMDSESAVDLNC